MADKTKPDIEDTAAAGDTPPVHEPVPEEPSADAPEILEGDLIDPQEAAADQTGAEDAPSDDMASDETPFEEPELLEAELVDPDAPAEDSSDEIAEEMADDTADDPQDDTLTDEIPAEDTPTAEPEPVEQAATEAAPQPAEEPKRKGGFAGALIGGVIAAGLGFAVGQQGLLDQMTGAPDPAAGIAANQAASASNAQQLADLAARLDAMGDAPAPVDTGPLADQITALEVTVGPLPDAVAALELRVVDLADLAARFDALDTRVTDLRAASDRLADQALSGDALPEDVIVALTSRIDAQSAQTDAALEAARAQFAEEVAALTQELDDRRAEAESLLAEAQAAQAAAQAQADSASKAAAVQADMVALQNAIDNGLPFADVLGRIAASGVEIPAGLSDVAADGVTPLAVLIETYPEAARAALAAAREGQVTGVTSFLQKQLGARSVTPREGADPDAILSRAEAAAQAGDLAKALTELDALPDGAKTQMESWTRSAQARDAAIAAMSALAAALAAN